MALKEYLDELFQNCLSLPDTPFDSIDFDVTIEPTLMGSGLRERLAEIANLQSTIHSMASKVEMMYNQAESRAKEAWEIANTVIENDSIKSKAKADYKKALVAKEPVQVQNDIKLTNYREEMYKLAAMSYLYTRARLKVKEIDKILDIGRTLLSFDKEEARNLPHME